MMNKTLLRCFEMLLLACSCIWMGLAQSETIHLNEAGTLRNKLGDKSATTTSLTVTGSINRQDLITIEQMPLIEVLDLSEASLVNRDGATSTELPEYCFSEIKVLRKVTLPTNLTHIGSSAFYSRETLEEVILPEGLISIGQSVFMSCTKLHRIPLPSTLKKIGRKAFYGTWALDTFEAPKSLESIGKEALYNSGIQRAILNGRLSEVGDAAFAGCLRLGEFIVPSDNPNFKTDPLDLALYSHDGKRLISYPGGSPNKSYKSPLGLETLAGSAFDGAIHLETIRLGGNIRMLPQALCYGCKSLTKLYVGESIDSIGVGIFESCPQLSEFHIRTIRVPHCAEHAFYIFNAPRSINLYAPAASIEDYKVSPEFEKVFSQFLVDNDEGDLDPTQDLILLTEDFEHEIEAREEWTGNAQLIPTQGTYIRTLSSGSKAMKLGDNEHEGIVRTKDLDLSGNGGAFRVRCDFDGWNDAVRSVWIDLVSENAVLETQQLAVYLPKMGDDMRTFDIPFSRGTANCHLVFRTNETERIAILDNIKVYTTSSPVESYRCDLSEIDFGQCIQGKLTDKKQLTLTLQNNNRRPSVKMLTEDIGIFDTQIEWKNDNLALITLSLDTSTKGDYSAFLRINLNDVNVLLIPVKASVIDSNNPLDLDDSHPITELDENFEQYTAGKIPPGWRIITPEGKRSWGVRMDTEGNRCMAINALETSGIVHSLLILPAIDMEQLKQKSLMLKLTTSKPTSATLHLVTVDKKSGATTILQDLTQMEETAWKEIEQPLESLHGIQFLALEYKGCNTASEQKTTIYRVDDVRIAHNDAASKVFPLRSQIELLREGDQVLVRGEVPFVLFDALGQKIGESLTGEPLALPRSSDFFLVQIGEQTIKLLAP